MKTLAVVCISLTSLGLLVLLDGAQGFCFPGTDIDKGNHGGHCMADSSGVGKKKRLTEYCEATKLIKVKSVAKEKKVFCFLFKIHNTDYLRMNDFQWIFHIFPF